MHRLLIPWPCTTCVAQAGIEKIFASTVAQILRERPDPELAAKRAADLISPDGAARTYEKYLDTVGSRPRTWPTPTPCTFLHVHC